MATGDREEGDVEEGDFAVVTRGLTKRFKQQVAVSSLDLLVPRGAVYGFLGPNGSGKTTTIRMLLGLIGATSGRHRLLGKRMPEHAREVLPLVGALVEGPAFHPYLSARANLSRLDSVDRHADPRTTKMRVDRALDRVGLLAAADKRYRAYSQGMRQRLAIAGTLLAPRELLVLDEPTNGLDPQGTREVRHLIGSLADDGATVLVSSHLLSEVEQVCTHIGVMHVGVLLTQGPIAQVRAVSELRVRLETDRPQDAARVLRQLGLTDVADEPGRAVGTLGRLAPEKIVAAMVHEGVPVTGFAVERPSLEDLFVSLTGEGFNVSG
ncbi:MAG: ATP-binding cassette domain-containing protein [Dermatophilaceae bacterium]